MTPMADPALFAGSEKGLQTLRGLVDEVLAATLDGVHDKAGPIPPGGPDAVAERTRELLRTVLPETGMGDEAALVPLARAAGWGGVDLAHPGTAAFLQAPSLTVAAAADVVTSALNQSVDVWDSGPFAMVLEDAVMEQLRLLVGLPASAAGVTTPGGSISNLMAVILARDIAGAKLTGADIRSHGLPAAGRQLRVVCSTEAHVSVIRAIAAAGLGDAAAVVVAGRDGMMRAEDVRDALAALPEDDVPFLLFATAGTTDLGAIDPLAELAGIAQDRGMWFHVDAAYGGGMLFSPRLHGLFAGIELADSVTLDLHKMAWQPASAGVLLVRDPDLFAPLEREAAYLNPTDDAMAGLPHRLGRTLETTRRADVLKAAAAFRSLGRSGMADLVDHCHALALYAQEVVAAHPRLEAAGPVTLTRLVFRYVPRDRERSDEINARLRRRLLAEGRAVIGRTERIVAGRPQVHLKLTMINPMTAPADLDDLIADIVRAGEAEEDVDRALEPAVSSDR